MMDQNVICFACGTSFQLLVAYILSTTIYAKNKKYLFVIKIPYLLKFIDILQTIHLWDELVVIELDKPIELYDQLFQEWVPKIDVFHIFSCGYLSFNRLFFACGIKGKKIILTEEGIGTYIPSRFNSWIEKHDPNRVVTNGFELEKIDEVWVFTPQLFMEKLPSIIKEINLEKFYKACSENPQLVADFKKLFVQRDDIHFDYDFIYFRQYYSLSEYYSKSTDTFVDELVCDVLKSYKTFVKDHPAYTNNPYKTIIDQPYSLDIPWEVLLILTRIDNTVTIHIPEVLISSTSSTMFNSNSMGFSGEYIFLYKIFEIYTDYRDDTVGELIDTSKKIFSNSRFYEPQTWEEYYQLVSTIAKNKGFRQNAVTLEEIVKKEKTWLQNQISIFWNKQLKDNDVFVTLKAEIAEHNQLIELLTKQRIENDLMIQSLTEAKTDSDQQLADIVNSKRWQIVAALGKIQKVIAPAGSLRLKTIQSIYRFMFKTRK